MSRLLARVLTSEVKSWHRAGPEREVFRTLAMDAIAGACSVIADRCEEKQLTALAADFRSGDVLRAVVALLGVMDEPDPGLEARAVFVDGRNAFDREKPLRVLVEATGPYDPAFGTRGGTPVRVMVLGTLDVGVYTYLRANEPRDFAFCSNEDDFTQIRVTNHQIEYGKGVPTALVVDGYSTDVTPIRPAYEAYRAAHAQAQTHIPDGASAIEAFGAGSQLASMAAEFLQVQSREDTQLERAITMLSQRTPRSRAELEETAREMILRGRTPADIDALALAAADFARLARQSTHCSGPACVNPGGDCHCTCHGCQP